MRKAAIRPNLGLPRSTAKPTTDSGVVVKKKKKEKISAFFPEIAKQEELVANAQKT